MRGGGKGNPKAASPHPPAPSPTYGERGAGRSLSGAGGIPMSVRKEALGKARGADGTAASCQTIVRMQQPVDP